MSWTAREDSLPRAPETVRCRSSLGGTHASAVGVVVDEAFLEVAAAAADSLAGVVGVAGGKDDVAVRVGN